MSENVRKFKNFKKISYNPFFSKKKFKKSFKNIFSKPKTNICCFSILGLCDSTRALQSCQILRKNLEKSLIITFFSINKIQNFTNIFFPLKKSILLVLLIEEIRFNQSSPVQPVAESLGGPLSVTEDGAGNPHV